MKQIGSGNSLDCIIMANLFVPFRPNNRNELVGAKQSQQQHLRRIREHPNVEMDSREETPDGRYLLVCTVYGQQNTVEASVEEGKAHEKVFNEFIWANKSHWPTQCPKREHCG